jgi:hypothetical protein
VRRFSIVLVAFIATIRQIPAKVLTLISNQRTV